MSGADYDLRVASAMDQVLEAERVAQSAIAECTRQSQESLERARQQARAILERAHQRVVALHTKSASALEQRQVPKLQKTQPVSTTAAEQLGRAHFEAAIAQLAQRLVAFGNGEM